MCIRDRVNDSSKETKFVSEAYKLVEGKHLENGDKNKILMHKDLAEKNNLKVGDKIKIKSNLFDADNEKGADETVEVEIKGLFDGHNSGGVSAAQELSLIHICNFKGWENRKRSETNRRED